MAREAIQLGGSEGATFDKLQGGFRYAIEGCAALEVLQGKSAWKEVALVLEHVMFQAMQLHTRGARVSHYRPPQFRRPETAIEIALKTAQAFEKVQSGLRHIIEAATELGVRQDRNAWSQISVAVEKLLSTTTQLRTRAATNTGRKLILG